MSRAAPVRIELVSPAELGGCRRRGPRRWWTPLAAAVCLAGSLLLPRLAHAAPPPWPAASFQYFAKQSPLSKVLTDFTGAFGLQLAMGPGVQGTVNGNYATANPSQFLDSLGASYGLTWYYRGGVLHVDRAADSLSRTLRVGRDGVPTLRRALESLGIFDARFGWGEFADRGVVIVSGPPSYVNAVAGTVDELGLGAAAGGEEIRMFPLKHARAEDRTFSYRDQQVTTPGIATILRGLVADGTAGALGTTTTNAPSAGSATVATTAPLSGGGDPRRAVAQDKGDGGDTRVDTRADTRGGGSGSGGGGGNAAGRMPSSPAPAHRAVIQADQRLNAVIVKDQPERMAAYEALIKQLDVPTPLVEIEAMIVDVNTDKVDSLGINWAGRKNGVTAGFGDVNADPVATTINIGKGTGFDSANLFANTANFFVSQVNALASRGEARILGRPSVLTVDNLVAVLDLSETFYVKTSGERVAQLTPISTGTLLKVTPRIIDENGRHMVQLIVDIEDGTVQRTEQVDQLPTVLQSNISTQAVILEDDSLLIGGYTLESDSTKRDKVPLLGDLPGIGALFRTDGKTGTRRERMFLIRPHIVQNPAYPELGRAQPRVQVPAAPAGAGQVTPGYDGTPSASGRPADLEQAAAR